jgi:hypothetical protein
MYESSGGNVLYTAAMEVVIESLRSAKISMFAF